MPPPRILIGLKTTIMLPGLHERSDFPKMQETTFGRSNAIKI